MAASSRCSARTASSLGAAFGARCYRPTIIMAACLTGCCCDHSLLYIVGYELIWNKEWLLTEVPTGTTRLHVLAPDYTLRNITSAADLSYCTGGTPAPAQRTNTIGGTEAAYGQFPCQFRDEYFARTSSTEHNALFLTTRVRQYEEHIPDDCDRVTRAQVSCLLRLLRTMNLASMDPVSGVS